MPIGVRSALSIEHVQVAMREQIGSILAVSFDFCYTKARDSDKVSKGSMLISDNALLVHSPATHHILFHSWSLSRLPVMYLFWATTRMAKRCHLTDDQRTCKKTNSRLRPNGAGRIRSTLLYQRGVQCVGGWAWAHFWVPEISSKLG